MTSPPPASRSSPEPREGSGAPGARPRAAGAHVVALARTQGALDELDDEIGAMAARRRWSPATSPTSTRSTGLAPPCSNASAGSTFSWAMAVFSGRSPVGPCRSEGLEQVMAVNVTANWRLIRSLDPLLRLQAPGAPVHHLGRGAPRAHEALLGPLRRLESRAGSDRPNYAAETENTSSIKVMLPIPARCERACARLAMPAKTPRRFERPRNSRKKRYRSARRNGARAASFTIFRERRVLDFAAPI